MDVMLKNMDRILHSTKVKSWHVNQLAARPCPRSSVTPMDIFGHDANFEVQDSYPISIIRSLLQMCQISLLQKTSNSLIGIAKYLYGL